MDIYTQNLIWFTQGSVLGLIGFVSYLELSPKLGGIWYRQDASGQRKVQLLNLLHFMSMPFIRQSEPDFWEVENWDINSVVVITGTGLGYMTTRNIVNLC